ncbi:hypothetical protein CC85DRAFT_281476, partial [Cutaneotrichosporon oleaginosum]
MSAPAPPAYFAAELAAALAAPRPPPAAEAKQWEHIIVGARLENRLVTELRSASPPHNLLPYAGGSLDPVAGIPDEDDDDDAGRIATLVRAAPFVTTIDLLADAPDTHLLLSLSPRVVRRTLPVYCPWFPGVLVEFADLATLAPLAPLLSRPMAPECTRHIVHVSDLLTGTETSQDGGEGGCDSVNLDGLRALGLLCLIPCDSLDLVLHGRRVASEDEWALWMGLFVRLLTPLANLLGEGTEISVVGLERLFPSRTVHLMTEGDEEAETQHGVLGDEVRRRAAGHGIAISSDAWARLRYISADEWLEETGIDDDEAELWLARPQYVQPLAAELCAKSLEYLAQEDALAPATSAT